VLFQSGDHGGIEGPLGACVATYGKEYKRKGLLLYQKQSLVVIGLALM